MRKKTIRVPKPIRSSQIPVTLQMLNEMEGRLDHKIVSVRDELKAEIHGVKSEIHDLRSEIHAGKSEFHDLRSEIQGVKSEIHEVKSEVQGLKSEIHEVKSEIHGVKSELHRMNLMMEEQRAQNVFVLDGYAQLYALIEKKLG